MNYLFAFELLLKLLTVWINFLRQFVMMLGQCCLDKFPIIVKTSMKIIHYYIEATSKNC